MMEAIRNLSYRRTLPISYLSELLIHVRVVNKPVPHQLDGSPAPIFLEATCRNEYRM